MTSRSGLDISLRLEKMGLGQWVFCGRWSRPGGGGADVDAQRTDLVYVRLCLTLWSLLFAAQKVSTGLFQVTCVDSHNIGVYKDLTLWREYYHNYKRFWDRFKVQAVHFLEWTNEKIKINKQWIAKALQMWKSLFNLFTFCLFANQTSLCFIGNLLYTLK